MDDTRFVDQAKPEEVFGILSNELRIAILRALWTADDRTVTFAHLRESVGNPDSGQFSYHLDTLLGPFVTKADSGYKLTQAGRQINGVIASGAYTTEGAIEPIELDDPCRACSGAQTFTYADEVVRVECNTCSATSAFAVPPSVFAGYDREAIPAIANRYLRTTIQQLTNGFCWFCDGRLRPTVAPVPEILDHAEIPTDEGTAIFDEPAETIPWVQFDCRRCGTTSEIGLGQALIDHPVVAGFYFDHGVDVRDKAVWSFPLAADGRVSITGRQPFRARATYQADGDEVSVVVDEGFRIIDITP